MAIPYGLGIAFAIIGGAINNLGQIFQKMAINKYPQEEREEKGFMKKLMKNPLWLLGIILMMAVGAVFYILAQGSIGGTLVPGLTASGMIVLVIGSIYLIKEKLSKIEIFGIILMIVGIACVGGSGLVIPEDISYYLLPDFQLRMGILTGGLIVLWFVLRLIGNKSKNKKAIILSFAVGIPFAIGNMWLQPMINALMGLFGTYEELGFTLVEIIILFIISAIMGGLIQVVGIGQLQEAYKHGDASQVVPITQIIQQIVPIFLYFFVFYGEIVINPETIINKLVLIIIGAILVIICGFILANRQVAVDETGNV
ncbi:MAG: hypothetical protein GY870_00895 [archaeon]|nr:hypothetical protein [archaeon]